MSKWTKTEEFDLITDVRNGKSIEQISLDHNRSVNAIEMRLKKIIYENVMAGKSITNISNMLHINEDKTRCYFYSYKEFKEKHTGNVDVFDTTNTTDNKNTQSTPNIQKISEKMKQLELENKMLSLLVENKNLHSQINKLIKDGKIDKNIKQIIKKLRTTKITP